MRREPCGGSPSASFAYQDTTTTRRPPTVSVSEASAEVEMPCGHQRVVRRSSRSQVSACRAASPGAKPASGSSVEVVEHAVEADVSAQQAGQRVDARGVLVGPGEVHTPGRGVG